MQVVIDIDENVFTRLFDNGTEDCEIVNDDLFAVAKSIRNGTPLTKGHGDLVDFDKLCEEYWDGNYMEIHKDDLPNIKPIIEADKEGEE